MGPRGYGLLQIYLPASLPTLLAAPYMLDSKSHTRLKPSFK